jgi:hypothetical protein
LDHWNSIKDPSWPSCPTTVQELENLPDYIKHELVSLHGCYHRFEFWLANHIDPCIFPNNVIYLWEQLDWARDYHHFDLLTAQWLVDQICQQLDR